MGRFEEAIITVPVYHSGGGRSFAEVVILARATKTKKPKTIFEMGTYNGLTTAVFMLNSAPDTVITTLDLPPSPQIVSENISSDKDLISTPELPSVPKPLRRSRHTQLLSHSMHLTPPPF